MESVEVVRKRKRVALIGIGGIARKVYLPLLCGRSDVELVGVVSRSEATVRQTVEDYRLSHGSTQVSDIASWDVDAVFIHSPTETHYDTVTACLDYGLPVYVDKPLSYDMDEARAMTALAEAKGLLLAVGFNRRFAPLYMNAYAFLAEAGGFELCEISKHRTRLQSIPAKETVYDDLIHILDLLLWLGNDSYSVLARQLRRQGNGPLLHASGMLSLGNERYGQYSMVRSAGLDSEKLSLHGGGRSAEVINMEQLHLYEKGQLPQQQMFGSWETILERRGFAGVVDHFLDRLNAPEQCSIRADLVLDTHELAEQLTAGL
ncbi:Gfo/Idh/MocA family protein [Paenibacillus kandeliae]|uniref:Gfo/Idh/MocA family protein n=1 Tax=Paenibacillus kandeliae TaxID=3231269 RepID=UPI00345B2515